VDIVAEGHKLPFCDQVFDGIICCAVLEHVNNPYKVVDEMYYVLKKGGYILCSVPFIYAFHSSTGTHQDFTRFTQFKLQELFSSFEKIETEQRGASISVISILSEYLALLITNKDILYRGLQRLFAWMLSPLAFIRPTFSQEK
jgi:ubiquinone/menaquinone biosynthesis C-methylase UbiE